MRKRWKLSDRKMIEQREEKRNILDGRLKKGSENERDTDREAGRKRQKEQEREREGVG